MILPYDQEHSKISILYIKLISTKTADLMNQCKISTNLLLFIEGRFLHLTAHFDMRERFSVPTTNLY